MKAADRAGHLLRKYGITLAQYDDLLKRQAGCCAICHRRPRPDISLHVDHDHESGRVRGLLCFRCNNALGDLGDTARMVGRAVDYLAKTEAPDELAAARGRALALKTVRPAREGGEASARWRPGH